MDAGTRFLQGGVSELNAQAGKRFFSTVQYMHRATSAQTAD